MAKELQVMKEIKKNLPSMENLHGLSGQFVDIHRPGSVVKNPPTMQEPQKTRG